jgi:hypothetical protein
MIAGVLFACYFLGLVFILQFLVGRGPWGIRPGMVLLLFAGKVLLGCLYGYIFLTYYGGDDTWMFFRNSLAASQTLLHQPSVFFSDLLPARFFAASPDFLSGIQSWLEHLEPMLMEKWLASSNLLGQNNYYIDVLFFDFMTFWGPYLLYRLTTRYFPERQKTILVVAFLIPSLTFWTSGIRAEGLILLFVSIIIYATDQWFRRRNFLCIPALVGGLIGFLIFRGQSLIVFLPAFFAWTICRSAPGKSLRRFAFTYLACGIVFFGSLFFSDSRNLAHPLVQRQSEFLTLHGNTRLPLDRLEPTFWGFIRLFPQAFCNTFLRPFLWEAKGPLQLLSALELLGFLCLVFIYLRHPLRDRMETLRHPLSLFFILFAVSQILLIGFTVPFPGAIVRYKAVPETLLIMALALGVDWQRLAVLYKLK